MIKKYKRLTEAQYGVKLNDADIMNPTEVNFKDKIRKAKVDDDVRVAKERRSAQTQELQNKYAGGIEEIKGKYYGEEAIGIEAALDALHDLLVPEDGKADSVAGEIVRAITRIIYRWFNGGDVFYEGYGLETCGGSASYLLNRTTEDISAMIMDTIGEYEDQYSGALSEISGSILSLIFDDTKDYLVPNNIDSRTYKLDSAITEASPKYDYDILIDGCNYYIYVDAGFCDEYWLIDFIRDYFSLDDSVELDVQEEGSNEYRVYFSNLSSAEYNHLSNLSGAGWNRMFDEMDDYLASEFGDVPDGWDDDDDDDDYDEGCGLTEEYTQYHCNHPTYEKCIDEIAEYLANIAIQDGVTVDNLKDPEYGAYLIDLNDAEQEICDFSPMSCDILRNRFSKQDAVGEEFWMAVARDINFAVENIIRTHDNRDMEDIPDDEAYGFDDLGTRKTPRERHNRTAYANGGDPWHKYGEGK